MQEIKFDFTKYTAILTPTKFKDYLKYMDTCSNSSDVKQFEKYWKFVEYFNMYLDDQSDLTIGKIIVESWKPISQVELAKRLGINRNTARRFLAGDLTTYQTHKLIKYVKSRPDYKNLKIWFNGFYMECYLSSCMTNYANYTHEIKDYIKNIVGKEFGKGSVEKDE